MVFAHPAVLWLLLAVVPLAAMHFGARRVLSRGRSAVVAGLRLLAFGCLIVALAGPIVSQSDPGFTVVYVADRSASVGTNGLAVVAEAIADRGGRDPDTAVSRLVVFDDAAEEIEVPGGGRWAEEVAAAIERLRAERSTAPASGSAVGDALALAGALVPHDGRGRIVLCTDGLETAGDALAETRRLADRGIPVEVHAVEVPRGGDVVLRAVSAPPSARLGASVVLEAEIEAGAAIEATLIVRAAAGGEETRQAVRLEPGRQRIGAECTLRTEGLARYTVEVEAAGDPNVENNLLPAAVYVFPALQIAVVEDDPQTPAASGLAALLGQSAKVVRMTPGDLNAGASFDDKALLVLADVPGELIDAPVFDALKRAVQDGMGLVVGGGRRSYGPGGWAGTSLAELLPVTLPQFIERRDPSTTLVVIIDTSGSMGGARVDLAKEIARLAIGRLKPHDKVGIVEFYGSKRWAAPIQSAANAIDLQRALNRLNAGGGTVILPAIEEAYYALADTRTRTKHVLVLTDGGVEPGAFEPLIRRMADEGITVSTVLVGPALHSAFLAELAHWGRGRFYTAPDRFNLPEVIVKQPESSVISPFVEKPVALRAPVADPLLRGVDLEGAPPIGGYVRTQLRPTADLVVDVAEGDPIVATWRYGLGNVVALTTQLAGEWTADLVQWPAYAVMTSNLVRRAARRTTDDALQVVSIPRPGAMEIRVVNRHPEGGAASAALEFSLLDGAGAVLQSQTVDPVAPHEWNVRLERLAPGSYVVACSVEGTALGGRGALAVAAEREVSALAADAALFENIAAMQAGAARAAAHMPPGRRPRAIWPVLVGAALVSFFGNVLARRWPPRRMGALAGQAAVAAFVLGFAGFAPTALAQGQAAAAAPPVSGLSESAQRALEGLLAETSAEPDVQFESLCRVVLERDGSLDALLAELQRRAEGDEGARRLLVQAAMREGRFQLAREAAGTLPDGGGVVASRADLDELLGDDRVALENLARALEDETDPTRRFALQVRRAAILYDRDDRDAGASAIQAAVTEQSGAAEAAAYGAHLAALYGDTTLAAALLPTRDEQEGMYAHLFRGSWLLRGGRAGEAVGEFEKAFPLAKLARDRQFILERVIDAARQSGTLPELARRWSSEPGLSPDALLALAKVLRELNRPDDALALLEWRAPTEEQRAVIDSPEFQYEVIAAALQGGRGQAAEAAYRALVAREPDNLDWRKSLGRLLLLDDRRADAEALFGDALGRLTDQASLLSLAQAAADLTLDEQALAAAKKAAASGARGRLRALLFEADLARRHGETDRALEMLRGATEGDELDDAGQLQVAEAFERFGDEGESLRLLRQVYERTGSEDVLQRLAWLLESNQRFDEAYGLWKRTWQETRVPARVRQAQERVLDLAARGGKLADLAIELEEKLDGGSATQREQALLVDIYTKIGDDVSAAEILHEIARQSGDEIATFKQLVAVYLSCEQFSRCNQVLRKLAELDPGNAGDYLAQIAIIALERKRPQDARAALAELAEVVTDEALRDEFSAGVLSMIGLSEDAARSYARLAARYPDRIESVLLWANAMKAAGKRDQAIGRLLYLVETSAEDDLFTVAVDGLLNMEAPPAALRVALRRIFTRIAAAPEKVFLYRLGVDVLEGMGRVREAADLLEQSVVVAGERRAAQLRELMDGAKMDGSTERLLRYGRSLVALATTLPPQVFLDLGEALLDTGEVTAAEAVFDRAGSGGDYAAIQQRAAEYYEAANLPAAAERVLRRLLVTDPDDVPLLIRAGDVRLQLSRFSEAFDTYDRAVNLMLRRLPARIGRDGSSARPGEPAESGPTRGAANLDEMAQHFENASAGLLESSRTQEHAVVLAEQFRTRVEEEIASLTARNDVAPSLAGNPRLAQLVGFARRVSFALHMPEVADAMDQRLIQLYPRDAALGRQVVQVRLDWGLHARAARFVSPGVKEDALPVELRLDRCLADPAALEAAVAAGNIDAALAVRLLPALLMTGRDKEAGEVLAATIPAVGKTSSQDAATLLAAAVALEDGDAVRRWLDWVLDTTVRNGTGGEAVAAARRCVQQVWNHLSEQEQLVLFHRLGQLAEGRDAASKAQFDLLRWRLSGAMPGATVDREALFEQVVKAEAPDTRVLLELLERAPAGQRVAMLTRAVAASKPDAVAPLLLGIVAKLTWTPDGAFRDAMVQLFRDAPPLRIRREQLYVSLARDRWNRNTRAPRLVRQLAETLLSKAPKEPAVIATAAIARATAGDHAAALPLVEEALESLLVSGPPNAMQQRMLEDLLDIMLPAEREALLADLEDRIAIEGKTPMRLFAQGVVLEALDRPEDALAAYRAAFVLTPDERTVSRKLIRLLSAAGREAELAEVLAANLRGATVMESFEWRTLITLYCGLYNLRAAAETAPKDKSPLGAIQIVYVASLRGRLDEVCAAFRRYMIELRTKGRYSEPIWPEEPSVGGMEGYIAGGQKTWRMRRKMFEALADQPFAAEEYSALLRAAPAGRRDVPGLARGLALATRTDEGRQALLGALGEAAAGEALTTIDGRLLVDLAGEGSGPLPDDLAAALEDVLVHTAPDDADTLVQLAKIEMSAGRPERAVAILRWVAAADVVMGHRSTFWEDRLDRLETYLGLLPAEQGDAERDRLLGLMAPTPLDAPVAEIEVARLERAHDAERVAAGLRERLDRGELGSSAGGVAAALAARAAAAGEVGDFETLAARAIAEFRRVPLGVVSIDCGKMLPSAAKLDQPQPYVEALVRLISTNGTEETATALPRAAATRSLCLLGKWCVDNGLRDDARRLLGLGRSVAASPGEHWLWLADLARACGDAAQAVDLEKPLMEAAALPVSRMPRLLDELEQDAGAEAADELAARAAAYSDHPVLLRRALRWAKRQNDAEAVGRIEARLEDQSPAQGS